MQVKFIELGEGVSNAVIGKIHRLGLSSEGLGQMEVSKKKEKKIKDIDLAEHQNLKSIRIPEASTQRKGKREEENLLSKT